MTRVFLTGGEGIGWALDEDLELTTRAVARLTDVEAGPLEQANIIHSVSPFGVAALTPDSLTGRRVVCHLENDLWWWMQQPSFVSVRERVDLWITQNRATLRAVQELGWPVAFVPYAVDTTVFRPASPPDAVLADVRKRWGLPVGRFLIGSFVRDTLGADLSTPKQQKGADVFLGIVAALQRRGLPIHCVIAGPRRHWIRARLAETRVPHTFVGEPTSGDDIGTNILDKTTLNTLYHLLDLYLVTSRWEGGPRVVLEAAATRCRILSTPVGLAPDILEPECLFTRVSEAVSRIEQEIAMPRLAATLDIHEQRVARDHTVEANAERLRATYQEVLRLPARHSVAEASRHVNRSGARSLVRKIARRIGLNNPAHRPGRGLRISLWNEFHDPPWGGGNQFMIALGPALERLGAEVVTNKAGPRVDVHICNATWFDLRRFNAKHAAEHTPMVHRIDGPTALYRGSDSAKDEEVFELNRRLAAATVVQSAWSYRQLYAMGYHPFRPVVIHNAVDARIFHRRGLVAFDRRRRIRLIATSWSDNPRKGGAVYKWLDGNLDRSRFEFTFVGRIQHNLEHARHVPPQPSERLAGLLREHDIYVTGSRHDPCSNALIEAMACGLPVLYLNDGGHPELAGHGGLPFTDEEDLLGQLERLVQDYELFQSLIVVPDLEDVARRYLETARLAMEWRRHVGGMPETEPAGGAELARPLAQ